MTHEFQFIETIRRKYSLTKIGDDCVVLPKDSKTDLVITTDLLVEDIDFRASWSKPEFIGHKALAVSLSDVAAMGAKPVWSMLSIGVPEAVWKTDFIENFYDAYLKLAGKFNVELVGGDVSKTPDKIVIDSIVAGEVKKGKAVLRSGAKVGDSIFVTGVLGGAAIGLKLLENGENYDQSEHKNLLLRQLAPDPQTEIGRILGENNLATAMIDLSDGLSSDLNHLCRESGVGANIYADQLPSLFQISDFKLQVENKLFYVLNGGEDFELLFTVSPKNLETVFSVLKNHQITKIGEINDFADGLNLIVGDAGKSFSVKIEVAGFQHF